MSRAAMLEETKANLASLRESSGILALEAPAAYSLAYADMIYNTDMQHSATSSKPIPSPSPRWPPAGISRASPPGRTSGAGGDAAVLQMIDYNVYPAYLLTEASSEEFAQCHTNDVLFLAVRRLSGRNRAGIRRRRSGSARGFGRLGDEPYLPRRRRFRHPVRQRENRHRQLHRYRFLTGRHRRARHAGAVCV